jgi:hypothetical protein
MDGLWDARVVRCLCERARMHPSIHPSMHRQHLYIHMHAGYQYERWDVGLVIHAGVRFLSDTCVTRQSHHNSYCCTCERTRILVLYIHSISAKKVVMRVTNMTICNARWDYVRNAQSPLGHTAKCYLYRASTSGDHCYCLPYFSASLTWFCACVRVC